MLSSFFLDIIYLVKKMAKQKDKRIKSINYTSDEQNEVKSFIIILIIVVVAIIAVYVLTRLFVSKDLFKNEPTKIVTPGEVNYSTVLIGSMLNVKEDEYYVIITDTSDPASSYYTGLMTTYKRNTKALPIYLADLSNELNKKYIGTKNNLNPTDMAKFMVKDNALIHIKDGKIVKAMSEEKDISNELKYVSETEETEN